MPDRIAIVGSRRRTDRDAVVAAVAALPPGSVVVSGGCRGVDTWAADAARARGLVAQVLRPDLAGAHGRGAVARRYHNRNQAVVDACERMLAFPAPDRTGGTEDAIRRAVAAGKPVVLL